jgi:hypothetical protein
MRVTNNIVESARMQADWRPSHERKVIFTEPFPVSQELNMNDVVAYHVVPDLLAYLLWQSQ